MKSTRHRQRQCKKRKAYLTYQRDIELIYRDSFDPLRPPLIILKNNKLNLGSFKYLSDMPTTNPDDPVLAMAASVLKEEYERKVGAIYPNPQEKE